MPVNLTIAKKFQDTLLCRRLYNIGEQLALITTDFKFNPYISIQNYCLYEFTDIRVALCCAKTKDINIQKARP